MSEERDLQISQLRRERGRGNDSGEYGQNGHHSSRREAGTEGFQEARPRFLNAPAGPRDLSPRHSAWVIAELLLRRWLVLVLSGIGCAAVAFLIGLRLTSDTATVSLIRRENPNAFTAGSSEGAPQAYLSRELSAQTLFGLMRSPEVFRRASAKANPPVAPEQLAAMFRVIPERNPDFVTLGLSGKQPKEVLAKWLNVCADEVVQYTKELQATEAGSIGDFLSLKLKGVEAELNQVNASIGAFSERAQSLDVDKEVEAYTAKLVELESKLEAVRIDRDTLDLRIENFRKALIDQTPGSDRLALAQDELDRLRAKGYTDLHPEVVRQKAIVESLQKPATPEPSSLLSSRTRAGTFANTVQFEILQLQGLKEVREREWHEYQALKIQMQEKAKRLSKTAVEYALLKAGQKRLSDLRVTLVSKEQEAELLRDHALGYFKVHAYATPEDITGRKRLLAVTLFSMVGGLLGMLAAAGLVFIAQVMDTRVKTAADLERCTSLPVLATLGDLRQMTPQEQINWAFRTLTILQGRLNGCSDETLVCGVISSQHGEGRSTWIDLLVSAASQRGMRVLTVATRPARASDEMPEPASKQMAMLPVGPTTTLTKSVLAFPAQVTEQFNDPKAQPIVHIPLPGWVWNLERRQQWRTALEHWENIPNLVLLIELPPACQPESVLLAEHLPQVIWLAQSGAAEFEETQAQLETLRHARCHLVGAVLNREPRSSARRRFATWAQRLGAVAAGAWLALATVDAAESSPGFSIVASTKRAAWQERLTLGPGDTLDVQVYGRPELTRTNLVVGPDGRISYLHLRDLTASGLTIDELRAQFDRELAKFYVTPRTIIVPTGFNSKKYVVLGRVVAEGSFVLDRPLTIIEAVARAKGLQTSSAERGPMELADLGRSFLVRAGKRVPVDLERLFHDGDLSQNVAIEPGDYLYFAPTALRDIFVLGEILSPGAVGVGGEASLLAAISARGGFTERAWRKRVLVVRGSLQRPEAYAIDAPAILAGRIPDFKLQPGDIVYVNARPWIRVEELLDIAAQSFIEASITAWAGKSVPALFTSPVVPDL
ncbi:MAG: polysaccharide biosynthesis/export family protein [Verrucomicrobiota bacterium]